MSTSDVAGVLSGLVKTVYSKDGVINLLADETTLQQDVPFEKGERIGLTYNTSVTLTMEQGFAYGAAGTSFTVNTPLTFANQQAAVSAFQMCGASSLDYDSFFRTDSTGEAAFDSASRQQVESLAKSGQKRTEISIVYGGDYLALVGATSGSGSSRVLTVGNNGSWAGGIWVGMEKATLDFWQSNGSTKVNSNAILSITSIDPVNKTITVSGNSTDLTAISTYVSANPNVGGIVFAGSGVTTLGDAEMVGLKLIAQNLTGTLFGISATTYSMWAGNTVNLNSTAITFAKIQDFVAQLVSRGAKGDMVIYLSPASWANLLTDQAALRMYDSSYSSADVDNGAETITFHSQNGKLMIKSHIYIKEGDALFVQPKFVKRIGSTDWTFGIPGMLNGQVWIQNSDTSYTLRSYEAQSVFNQKPATSGFMTGIVNT